MLNEGQQNALDRALETSEHLTISGPAGSGKSFLTKYIIEGLKAKMKRFALAAPTHQAKIVLAGMSGEDACTIHSLLKIHPDTYEDQRMFEQSEVPDLAGLDVLLIDEASMYDDDLVNIMLNTLPKSCRIIAIGDKDQIQPVRHADGHLSPLFDLFECVYLDEIVRQAANNPLIQVATEIREGGWFRTNWDRATKCGMFHIPDSMKMINQFLKVIKTPEDLLNYRMFAFTNKNVDILNGFIRQHVYKTDLPFVDGEYLVLQQPVSKTNGKFSEIVLNNGEIVRIINEPEPVLFALTLPRMETEHVEVAFLEVEQEEGDIQEVCVLWGEEAEKTFGRFMFRASNEYKGLAASRNRKMMWQAFWALKDRMVDTKSLGASTLHKAQGITIKGAAIYTADLDYADPCLRKQLAYVGSTRAEKWCLFY
ncbi:Dda-like helicase [Vibrio phage D479]